MLTENLNIWPISSCCVHESAWAKLTWPVHEPVRSDICSESIDTVHKFNESIVLS